MYQELTDRSLINLIEDGDIQAFDTVFMGYYPKLVAYARQFVNAEDSEEIVQDLMLWLWNNRENLYLESSLKNYLFVSVRNRCLTLINRQKHQQLIFNSIRERADYEQSSFDFYSEKELRDKVESALSRLPESYREAFVMNRYQNMTYKQIAEQLNVSSKTVDYRIQQALKGLRIELKDYLPFIVLYFPTLFK